MVFKYFLKLTSAKVEVEVEVELELGNNKKNKKNPHLNFPRRNGIMGMKFGTQT